MSQHQKQSGRGMSRAGFGRLRSPKFVAAAIGLGLVVGAPAVASAEVSSPYWSSGEGSRPSYVYNGSLGPVYGWSMPGFPSGKQFAGLENGSTSNRWIVMEYRGVAGGTAYCLRARSVKWMGSSVQQAWVVQRQVGGCTPGATFRVS